MSLHFLNKPFNFVWPEGDFAIEIMKLEYMWGGGHDTLDG
jgi:hypothetical protein